jgi:two-component system response regulator YesN
VEAGKGGAMKNLLIVEDETLIRLGMKVMLDWTEIGVQIVGDAENGKEAMQLIESQRVDIIITDIRMPVMDGMELIRICKEKYPDIRFIILSSYDDFQYAKEAIQLGVSDYILKPTMKVEEIKSSIGKVLLTFPKDELSEAVQTPIESLVQQELLKEHILENSLQEEVLKLREEEKELFRVPFWQGGVQVGLAAPKNHSTSLNILFLIIKDHINSAKMEAVMLRGGVIVVFLKESESESESENRGFHLWREELGWKVTQSLDTDIYWHESPAQIEWRQTRRTINEMILNVKLERNEGISEIVQKALEFMAARFQEAIGLEQVADLVGVTPSYFSRLFKHNTGQSFIQYLSKLRFEMAKELLLNSSMTAASVGKAIGYPNPRYFTKWFKVMTGLPPNEYRRLNQFSG